MSESKKRLTDLLMQSGFAGSAQIVDMVQKVIWDELREEFIKALTVDSDRRQRGLSAAIFDPETGRETFTRTDLGMVLAKYDQAVKNMMAVR